MIRLFCDANVLFSAAHNPDGNAALRANATHLLPGDLKDFGVFMNKRKKTRGVLIQSVGSFLDSVVQDS